MLLGVPHSDDESLLVDKLAGMLDEQQVDADLMFKLGDPQCSLLALRVVIAQRNSYLIRSVSPRVVLPLLLDHDNVLWKRLAVHLGVSTTLGNGSLYELLCMPMREGGMGLRKGSFYNTPAFVAAVCTALPLMASLGCADNSMVREADVCASLLFEMSLTELCALARETFHFRSSASTGVKPRELKTTSTYYDLHGFVTDMYVTNAIRSFVPPVIEAVSRANEITSFKGMQKFLSAPLQNSYMSCVFLRSANGSQNRASELYDNWISQLKAPLATYWKSVLPVGQFRMTATKMRGAISLYYRCPQLFRSVPIAIARPTQLPVLHCHLCSRDIKVDIEQPDVSLNGVCHSLRCRKHNHDWRHQRVGRLLVEYIQSCGVPVAGVEPNFSALNINTAAEELDYAVKKKNRLDFVVNVAGVQQGYDHTIPHVTRSVSPTTALQCSATAKRKTYVEPLQTVGLGFAPIVISALGFADRTFTEFVAFYSKIAHENDVRVCVKSFLKKVSVCLASFAGAYTARCYYNIKV